ncbi:DAK2 domain-containing protein, partial [Clavibacter michiganensis]|uniref:DAK2 domain-containing protein n=1 Tax=Clavibacter michiganensis TaxID=28447 RepID=UPI00118031DB
RAAAAVEAGAGARTALRIAGEAWSDKGGGTSGALWGLILQAVGDALDDDGDAPATAESVSAGIGAARDAVMGHGKASLGDKTMVDALVPFADALAERVGSGAALDDAWTAASTAAREAADATAAMRPGIGRARSHGERSVGTPDPGAVSLALIAATVGRALADG